MLRFLRAVGTTALLAACAAPAGDEPAHDDALQAESSAHVRVIVEPGDGGAALLAAISGATASIHVTMYLLTDSRIVSALIARHKAGVDVKVVLNKIIHGGGGPVIPNQKTFDALSAAGVPVVWAPATFLATHEKAFVLDGATAWIMTMNAATTSLTKNREYLAVDTAAADVAEAEAQFAADFAGQPFAPSGSLVVAPVNAREKLLALVSGASATLDVEAEELSDKAMTGALCDATGRGVVARVVLSTRSASAAQKQAIVDLKGCGVTVVGLSHPYVHAKAIVADGKRAYVGSANLSLDSLDHNRELGLVTAERAAVAPVAATVASDIAAGSAL
jgi:phosphatidylserine/phosphatidylglycerophosphate/cardiolipin synthase-like enzyme